MIFTVNIVSSQSAIKVNCTSCDGPSGVGFEWIWGEGEVDH